MNDNRIVETPYIGHCPINHAWGRSCIPHQWEGSLSAQCMVSFDYAYRLHATQTRLSLNEIYAFVQREGGKGFQPMTADGHPWFGGLAWSLPKNDGALVLLPSKEHIAVRAPALYITSREALPFAEVRVNALTQWFTRCSQQMAA